MWTGQKYAPAHFPQVCAPQFLNIVDVIRKHSLHLPYLLMTRPVCLQDTARSWCWSRTRCYRQRYTSYVLRNTITDDIR